MSESWIVYSIEKEDYKLEIYGIYTTQEQIKVHILDILDDFIEDEQSEDDQHSLFVRHDPPNM